MSAQPSTGPLVADPVYDRQTEVSAFTGFYDESFRSLCYYALRWVGRHEIAEDLVHDTFRKLWEKRAEFSGEEHRRRFMYVATKNACISWLRSQNTQKSTLENIALTAGNNDDGPDLEMIHSELLGRIYHFMEEMPETGSLILRRSLLEGLSHDQIASELSMTANAVAVKKFRAITILKTRLRKSFEIC